MLRRYIKSTIVEKKQAVYVELQKGKNSIILADVKPENVEKVIKLSAIVDQENHAIIKINNPAFESPEYRKREVAGKWHSLKIDIATLLHSGVDDDTEALLEQTQEFACRFYDNYSKEIGEQKKVHADKVKEAESELFTLGVDIVTSASNM